MTTEKAATSNVLLTPLPKIGSKTGLKTGLAAIAIIAFAVFIALMPWQVSAQQTGSHVFSGSVSVGGQAPRNGSILTAWTRGVRLGEVAVQRGRFRIVIPLRDDVGLTSREISFRLDARKLHGTGVWRAGRTTDLELTITKAEYLRGTTDQDRSSTTSPDQSFVGVEPAVCDTMGIDGGVLRGAILRLREVENRERVQSLASEVKATLSQIGCRLLGEWKIASPSLNGSGPFQGTVDGNFVRFTVPGGTNGAGGSLNFSGIYGGNNISGQYFSSRTTESGEWVLGTRRHAAGALADWARSIEQSSPGVLAEFRRQWEVQAAEENQSLFNPSNRSDSPRANQVVRPTPPAPAKTENQAPATNTVSEPAKTAPTEEPKNREPKNREPKNRGFFTNSISADSDSLNTLDPTMLAVTGILLTLVATAVQMFRGN